MSRQLSVASSWVCCVLLLLPLLLALAHAAGVTSLSLARIMRLADAASGDSLLLRPAASLASAMGPFGAAPPAAQVEQRFLTLVSATEGMASWVHSVREASAVARDTSRTLVEPCVSNGWLLPCRWHGVTRLPNGTAVARAIANGEDPLALMRSSVSCPGAGSNSSMPPSAAPLPLSAYFDWDDLVANWSLSPMIRYHEWEALRVAPRSAASDDVRYAGLLRLTQHGLIKTGIPIVMARSHDCESTGAAVDVGGYAFTAEACPERAAARIDGVRAVVSATLRSPPFDDAIDVFASSWMRVYGNALESEAAPLPRFHTAHYAAARAWVSSAVRGGDADTRYAVLQWRSVKRSAADVEWCASRLMDVVPSLQLSELGIVNATSPPATRLVLVADLPSPSNLCGIWDHRTGSDAASRQVAAQRFADAGYRKYDADNWRLDAGIVSIRDAALAAEAEWYFGCSDALDIAAGVAAAKRYRSATCVRCYWPSTYVAQVVLRRSAAGRPSNVKLDHVNASTVQPPVG